MELKPDGVFQPKAADKSMDASTSSFRMNTICLYGLVLCVSISVET